ncbi:MAG: beta-ketoacyl-ACP synthase II [Bacteroidales bacterium]|jgi:3-oxoacyl-[acyl-carrier-protein] synthase II|nr:beta-ketoacyl-ACP synthase II [Bacteroidales bacterium]MDD4828979.1 beta-ketoacyl-ACP synthase II [Bacteroidales bacterium]
MQMKRVVVTGIGALTPIGLNISDFWDNLVKGVSGAAPITYFDAAKAKTRFACELKNFDPNPFFDRKELRKYDRFSQYGIIASDQAINDSGANFELLNKDRVGVIWASGIGGITTFQQEVKDFVLGDGSFRFSPLFIPKMIADICAGHISIRHDLRGPNFATVSACASSANAIADAALYIKVGKADMMVCGGSEASIVESSLGGFSSMTALSTRNDDPQTASRPFDKDRDGFVLGEGAGAVVLEELEHALARGAKIYAEVMGSGLTADAYHMTASHPEGRGAHMAMKLALEEGELDINSVDHINTHGTSTPVGDISEPKAIVSLFGEHATNININSTKSMTGHLLGAAGAVEFIATVLTIVHGVVPPTINHFTDDPELPQLNYTFNKAQQRDVNVALSNTFGFGGHNASIALKKYSK